MSFHVLVESLVDPAETYRLRLLNLDDKDELSLTPPTKSTLRLLSPFNGARDDPSPILPGCDCAALNGRISKVRVRLNKIGILTRDDKKDRLD